MNNFWEVGITHVALETSSSWFCTFHYPDCSGMQCVSASVSLPHKELKTGWGGGHCRMQTTRQSRSVLEKLARKLWRVSLWEGSVVSPPWSAPMEPPDSNQHHEFWTAKSPPSPLPLATSRSTKKDYFSKAVSNKEKEFLKVKGERERERASSVWYLQCVHKDVNLVSRTKHKQCRWAHACLWSQHWRSRDRSKPGTFCPDNLP